MKFLQKIRFKRDLRKAFRASGVCFKRKVRDEEKYIYPKIVSVRELENRIEAVFVLPSGIKPSKVEENKVIFKQVFGSKAEIETDHIKKCVLNIYTKSILNKVTYNYDKLTSSIEDMVIPIICGIDINGEILAIDLSQEAHLLLSGETGSGKSSLLRVILTTLIKSYSAEDIQFVLGDLKRSEFGIFRNVGHVRDVCVKKDELLRELKKIDKEMKRRGNLLDKAEVNHISELKEKLPYLIVCIDEVALLKNEKDHMRIIEDISSIGRALGVHLILSMQRPDSKLLDGALKNNLRVRISGRQSNHTNAKVAGVYGADKIGKDQRGRMIIKLDDLQEFQAPLLENEKAKSLLQPYKIPSHATDKDDSKVIGTYIVENEQQEEKPILGVLDDE